MSYSTASTASTAGAGGAGEAAGSEPSSAGEAQRRANDRKKQLRVYSGEIDNLYRYGCSTLLGFG